MRHGSGDDAKREAALRSVEEEMNRKKIPQTDSILELAAFWDTHDLTEFEDELEKVSGTVFERQPSLVAVPLQPSEWEAAKQIADSNGSRI